jgi:hypothetical protein
VRHVRPDLPAETTDDGIAKAAFGAAKQTSNADALVGAGSTRESPARINRDRIFHSSGFSPLLTSASRMSCGFDRSPLAIFLTDLPMALVFCCGCS